MTVASGMYFGVFLAGVLPAYATLCWITGRYRFSAPSAAHGLEQPRCFALPCFFRSFCTMWSLRAHYGRYPHPGSELALSALSLESLFRLRSG